MKRRQKLHLPDSLFRNSRNVAFGQHFARSLEFLFNLDTRDGTHLRLTLKSAQLREAAMPSNRSVAVTAAVVYINPLQTASKPTKSHLIIVRAQFT
jgi:hypothetical protein